MRRVRFTPEARSDFVTAYRWLDRRNPMAAARWYETVRAKCALLGELPGIGAPRGEILSGMRVVWQGPYAIYHIVLEEEVVILRILHASRDHDAIFRGED